MTCPREPTAHACMECGALVLGLCSACGAPEGGCSACGAPPNETGPLCCCSGCLRDARVAADLQDPEPDDSEMFGSGSVVVGFAYPDEGRGLGSF